MTLGESEGESEKLRGCRAEEKWRRGNFGGAAISRGGGE